MREYHIVLYDFVRDFKTPNNPIIKSDIQTWIKACNILSEFNYLQGSELIKITIGWKKALTKTERVCGIQKMYSRLSSKDFEQWIKTRSKDRPDLNLNLKAESINEIDYNIYIFRALYESFLALNLSSPGSFCFKKARCYFKTSHNFDVNCILFESAWIKSIDFGWPSIYNIDLEVVLKWLRKQDLNTEEFAKTKMQRVVYALLHACSYTSLNDSSRLIWLAYALEAIYETSIGQAFNVLNHRIIAFLDPPGKIQGKIKKRLKEFYEERHKFVHGHSSLTHPLEDYEVDSEAFKQSSKILELSLFVFIIILATIQKCILNSWSSIDFKETWTWNGIDL